jgi:hypothetical protein
MLRETSSYVGHRGEISANLVFVSAVNTFDNNEVAIGIVTSRYITFHALVSVSMLRQQSSPLRNFGRTRRAEISTQMIFHFRPSLHLASGICWFSIWETTLGLKNLDRYKICGRGLRCWLAQIT